MYFDIAFGPDNNFVCNICSINHDSGEKKMKKQFVVRSLAAATAMAVVALSAPAANAAAGFTGSAAVVSKYVLRGGTMVPENSGAAVQSGINYDTGIGLYLGWWGSSLDYTVSSTPVAASGFENDFIAGYSMEAAGLTLDFGLVQYYYLSVDESDAIEPYANVTWKFLTAGAKLLAKDVIWGNKGDIYLTVGAKHKLPADFTVSGLVGFYKYDKSGKFESANSLTAGLNTTESSGLKHIDLTVSHPLGKTGLDMSVTYIVGGDDRSNTDLKNTMVLGISGAF
jgi:uncharacterized protein (TIGR02001 family)